MVSSASTALPQRTRSRLGLLLGLAVPAAFCAVARSEAFLGIRWTKAVADAGLLGFQLEPHWMVKKIVQYHFPGAMPGVKAVETVLETIKPFGVEKDNVVYGQSVATDEINQDPGHVATLLTNHWGRHYPLGGLAGVPFVGKSGFGSFAAHVPSNGHVFVFFGPHIGYTPQGSPGKFLRKGQDAPSATCSAAMAAYSQLTTGKGLAEDPSDMQQAWLRNKLAPCVSEITGATYPSVMLAYQTYKIIERELANIISTGFGPGKLVLLGGITVNMPYPVGGYFMPLHFSIRSRDMAPMDLLDSFGIMRPDF